MKESLLTKETFDLKTVFDILKDLYKIKKSYAVAGKNDIDAFYNIISKESMKWIVNDINKLYKQKCKNADFVGKYKIPNEMKDINIISYFYKLYKEKL